MNVSGAARAARSIAQWATSPRRLRGSDQPSRAATEGSRPAAGVGGSVRERPHPAAGSRRFATIGLLIGGLTLYGTLGCSPRSLIESDSEAAPGADQSTSAGSATGDQIAPSQIDHGPIAASIDDPGLLDDRNDGMSRPNAATDADNRSRAGSVPTAPLSDLEPRSDSGPPAATNPLADPNRFNAELETLATDPAQDQTAEDHVDRIRRVNNDTQRLGRDVGADREIRQTLANILEIKVKAARKLADDPMATRGQTLIGLRSEIEGLSGLASLGSKRAADELITAATEALDSGIEPLENDGRVVLIAMAVQDLVRGDNEVVGRIVDLSRPFATAPPEVTAGGPAIAILMTLGSAREKLNEYGHGEAADFIRQVISAGFARSSSPEIASLAAEMAGNVVHDQVDQLRAEVIEGNPVSVEQWREAVESLIDEAPDLQTVRYLAPLACEMESWGQDELAGAIYEVLPQRFSDPSSATGIEAELAVRLAARRKSLVGELYDPDLPSIDQTPLRLADYRGQIVLMPFWAWANPESLSIVPELESIQKNDPKNIAIVGMKLDPTPSDQDTAFNFRSFVATGAAADGGGNPVAIHFGLSALPFVAVIDPDGKIAGIAYRGPQVQEMVTKIQKEIP